jgi:hypothetical protein
VSKDDPTWKTSLPFPRHWFAYLALKLVVLTLVVVFVLRMYGLI